MYYAIDCKPGLANKTMTYLSAALNPIFIRGHVLLYVCHNKQNTVKKGSRLRVFKHCFFFNSYRHAQSYRVNVKLAQHTNTREVIPQTCDQSNCNHTAHLFSNFKRDLPQTSGSRPGLWLCQFTAGVIDG